MDARFHTFYGAQKSLFTLVTNLASTELEPIVLLPGEGVLAEQYRQAGINVDILPLGKQANRFGGEIPRLTLVGKLRVLKELFKYNLRVARWLRKNKIDVLYANDLRALLYVGIASKLCRKPLLWYVRVDGRPSVLSRVGLRLADRIILIADGVSSLFSPRDLAKFQQKFSTLYTGFALKERISDSDIRKRVRASYGIPLNAKVIGIVASITYRKGHDLLIAAFNWLHKQRDDLHLLIVGDSPVGHEDFKTELVTRIEEQGLSERVHWVGYQNNVTAYYQAMDVLALPSRSEGLPRTIIEALGMGIPIVATDVGGVREILTSEDLGMVVPPDDVESLSHALWRIVCSSDLHTEQRQSKRRDYVEERFSVEAYVRGFVSIVNNLS